MQETIMNMVGSAIDVNLPISVGANPRKYRFTFVVDSVKQIEWRDYRPAAWLPPHPPVHRLQPTTEDQITAAILVGSFLGFFRYVLTMKKSPVSE
jgi:hypothetical protein